MTLRTPNTFIIGAGPVATALAGALRLGGIPVLGLWARRPQAAREAAFISGVASFSSAPPDILLEAEVVLMAVRDQAVESVATMLVESGLITRRHIFLHCSGAISASEAFGSVHGRIGGAGTIHPLRAIADGRVAMREFAGTVFGIEGDELGELVARNLVTAMGGKPLALSGEQMAVYHAAAAMASNYAVTLLDVAVRLLGTAGVAEPDAVAALKPLMAGSLDNVVTGPETGLKTGLKTGSTAGVVAAALTGPIRRGDPGTVGRHLATMNAASGDSDVHILELYRVLGRATVALARRLEVTDARALDEIDELLA